jgi:mycoredoxin-dependent peroxiredoxin
VGVAADVEQRGAVMLGISGDSAFSHAEFQRRHAFPFPLLSDIHRTAIRAYGVWDEDRNVAYRSTFIVDREGRLRWGQAGDRHMVRSGREMLRVLDLIHKLRNG